MDSDFLTALIALTALNSAIAGVVLLRTKAPIDMGKVRDAVGFVLLANLLQMLWLTRSRLHFFGVMNIAWQDLTVVMPLAGAVVVGARLRGRAVTTPALPIGLYAQLIEPFDVRLEQTTVPVAADRAGNSPLRIAVLADIQSTAIEDHQRDAVARLMALAPDIVLIPGDLYQGPRDAFPEHVQGFRELLISVDVPGGVWVVPGNADTSDLLVATLEGTPARLLRDEQVTVTVRDRRATIFGLDEIPHERYQVWRDTPQALSDYVNAPGDDIRILMAHRPRIVSELPQGSRCDLVVAGHTHGGQVALPWIGPPIVLSPLPRHVAAGGLHELGGNRLYVSRGLGLERHQAPRIRLGAPPEVTLLTLSDREAASDDGS